MYEQCNRAGHTAHCGPAYYHYGAHHGRYFRANGFRRPKYNVPMNIADTGTAYEVHVYAVGFAKEDIKISVADDVLYISGTRTIDEEKEPNFNRQEFPVKSFERMLALNEKVDIENISARQENGVLIIMLPKKPEAMQPATEIKVN